MSLATFERTNSTILCQSSVIGLKFLVSPLLKLRLRETVKARFTGSAQTARARLAGIQDIGIGAARRTGWYTVSQIGRQLIKTGQRNTRIVPGKLVFRAFNRR